MIELNIKELIENIGKQVVLYALDSPPLGAPELTGDLRDSIRMSDFDPSDNSIDVYIDPAKIGVNHPKTQRWKGMLYPEIVHKGHKTRYNQFKNFGQRKTIGQSPKSYIPANPFFERAMNRIDVSKLSGVIFRIIQKDL